MNTPQDPQPAADAAAGTSPRRRALGAVIALLALGAVGYSAWQWLGGATEATDNAYVQANVVPVQAQSAGTVVAIQADDTDFVRAGQLLVKLDAADARIALEQAEAQLAQTVREVRQLYAGNATLQSQVSARDAELARARNELARVTDDAARRAPLAATGAIGKEELTHANAQVTAARSAVAAAESALQAARDQLLASQNLTDGTNVTAHPQVQRAAAKVRESWVALRRAEQVAPIDGHVARRSVQVGQRVQAGTPLLTLVSLRDAWVEANFKEGQLARLRIGQPARLWADVYGKKVEYRGVVSGMGAGTGAAFALLPAQNATGNWIKVVQRVPVRIKLDPKELVVNPLRVGLSMQVSVDVARQDGKTLSDAPRDKPVAETPVYDSLLKEADVQVRRIITQNLGRAPVREVRVPHGPTPVPSRISADAGQIAAADLPADAPALSH